MRLIPLRFPSSLEKYEQQAKDLLTAFRAGEPEAFRRVREQNPTLEGLSDDELKTASFDVADARLTLAHWYDFDDWTRLAEWVAAAGDEKSSVHRFESAVEAVIAGDVVTLASLLRADPALVRARSTRTQSAGAPPHRGTLLHYLAANGVEGHRQKSPKNAVDVAKILLDAGAEVDALAEMYGGHYPTLPMLVSSAHPAEAGVQVPLVDTLVDYGAAVEGRGSGIWASPLMTALAFGYLDAAEALVRRGARVDDVAAAAGLGRVDDVARLLDTAGAKSRHRALALAAALGHAQIVRLLLDAGEDPNRYNPEGTHAHSVPLHQAVWSDHEDVVRLLVEHGARLDIRDRVHDGTPLDWAVYGGRTSIAEYLRARGAPAADDG